MNIVFMIVILALIAGAIYYLSKRFSLFFSTSLKAWLWGLGGISIIMLVCTLFFSMTSSPVGRIVNVVSSLWMIVILYLVLSVAVVDLINLLFKLKPIVHGLLSLALTLLIVGYGIINAYSLKVEEVTIPVEGLTKEIRAVHITDIHLGNFRGRQYLDKIVNKTIELKPDVVFNTGDMFDSKIHFTAGSDVLEPLKKFTVPHYFVYGNHDQYVGVEEVVSRMKDAGAVVLQNKITNFGELQIVGLNNMAKDTISFDPHTLPGSETIEDVMAELVIEQNRPTIVLHHRPEGVEYMDSKGADLLLSGHTHAGQMFPFTLVAELMYEYNKGLYKYNDMDVYVSEGAGTIFAPLRLGTHSDITLIRLIPK